MSNRLIKKYLDLYAEEEATQLTIDNNYDHSLIIPANRESSSALKSVWHRLPEQISLLVIIVINSSDADEESDKRLFESLTKLGLKTDLKAGMCLVNQKNAPDLLIIDRFSRNKTISKRQGVGLARKIGSDVALQLYEAKCINSPWLRNTDADAALPSDYFNPEIAGVAGFLYPFRHVGERTKSGPNNGRSCQHKLAASL